MSNRYQRKINWIARIGTKLFAPTTFYKERVIVRQVLKNDSPNMTKILKYGRKE